jgi:hypothetical protein
VGFYTLKRYNHFGYHNLYELTDKSLFDANRRLASTEILPLSLYDTTGTVEHSKSSVPTKVSRNGDQSRDVCRLRCRVTGTKAVNLKSGNKLTPSKETKRKVEDLGITECCQLDMISSCVRNDTVHILPGDFTGGAETAAVFIAMAYSGDVDQ